MTALAGIKALKSEAIKLLLSSNEISKGPLWFSFLTMFLNLHRNFEVVFVQQGHYNSFFQNTTSNDIRSISIFYLTLDGTVYYINRLNSGNFGIFFPNESILILKSSVCTAFEIIQDDIKIVRFPWDFKWNIHVPTFAWAFA